MVMYLVYKMKRNYQSIFICVQESYIQAQVQQFSVNMGAGTCFPPLGFVSSLTHSLLGDVRQFRVQW